MSRADIFGFNTLECLIIRVNEGLNLPQLCLSFTHFTPYIPHMIDDLYNTDILTLAAQLEDDRLVDPDGSARDVSKLCGSELEIDVKLSQEGKVTDVALRVQACALGQSSAAILQEAIIGAPLEEVIEARDALRAMLKDGGPPPKGRFEKLSLLAGVKDYPARHTSTMLAFTAAVKAIEAALFK